MAGPALHADSVVQFVAAGWGAAVAVAMGVGDGKGMGMGVGERIGEEMIEGLASAGVHVMVVVLPPLLALVCCASAMANTLKAEGAVVTPAVTEVGVSGAAAASKGSGFAVASNHQEEVGVGPFLSTLSTSTSLLLPLSLAAGVRRARLAAVIAAADLLLPEAQRRFCG